MCKPKTPKVEKVPVFQSAVMPDDPVLDPWPAAPDALGDDIQQRHGGDARFVGRHGRRSLMEKTKREKLEGVVGGLKADRQPFEPDWEEIGRLSLPRVVDVGGNNQQQRKKRAANQKLADTGGLLAGRKLVNGMATGMSSSSRPWFKLAPRDRDMMEYAPVKEWLYAVETVIYQYFAATNFYDATKVQYGDLGHMGVGCTLGLEHSEYLGVYHTLPVGSYWLGLDDGLRVDTLVRATMPTVKQLVESVRDKDKLSDQVNRAYDKCEYGMRVPCMHVIEKNRDAYGDPLSPNGKPWRSIKWEIGQNDKNILLSESGFDSQPFTAPRWEVYGDATYCDSAPGFQALADLRELQLAAKRGGRAMDGIVKPPMGAPASLSRTGLSLDPGHVTYLEMMGADSRPGPLFTVPYQSIDAIQGKIDWLTRRVDQIFYADLFMAISDMEGVQPRNEQELLYRQEEKLTQLGPVVDRVNIEKLEYDIDRAYTICKNLGLLPPPPPELEGEPLTVDFISILAQAQKAAANTAIERAARFVGFIGGMFPEAVIKFDAEQAIDEFAQNSGTSPKIIRSDEIVARMREEQAAQKQQAQLAAMAGPAKDAAGAAELLSRTEVSPGENALQRMLGQ
jgi:hypothetical protein